MSAVIPSCHEKYDVRTLEEEYLWVIIWGEKLLLEETYSVLGIFVSACFKEEFDDCTVPFSRGKHERCVARLHV
jgi:hypothetical protein